MKFTGWWHCSKLAALRDSTPQIVVLQQTVSMQSNSHDRAKIQAQRAKLATRVLGKSVCMCTLYPWGKPKNPAVVQMCKPLLSNSSFQVAACHALTMHPCCCTEYLWATCEHDTVWTQVTWHWLQLAALGSNQPDSITNDRSKGNTPTHEEPKQGSWGVTESGECPLQPHFKQALSI